MDWWRERHRAWSGRATGRGIEEGSTPTVSTDIGREIARVAESEGRDRERHVTEHLELLCRLLLETRS